MYKITKQYYLSVAILSLAIFFLFVVSRKETLPIHQPFKAFPIKYNGWVGKEFPFTEGILENLGADDYLNRLYVKNINSIWFYIGYYGSQRKGYTYHSPKHCLPGEGWQILKTTIKEIHPAGMKPISINKMIIQKGIDKRLVFYWYQDRGRIVRSEYMAKLYLIRDSIFKNRSDGSMVRVLINFSKSQEKAEATATEFIEGFFPLLKGFLPS